MNILITGANGFVGSYLQKLLKKNKKINLFLLLREKNNIDKKNSNVFYADFENKNLNWNKFLQKIDVVVHLAARQHKISFKTEYKKYDQINSKLVKDIIEGCQKNRVKKFVYLSSAKVYQESSNAFKSYSINDDVYPVDFYSKSKYSGEIELSKKINEKKTEIYIIRVPLIYGGNPKGYLSTFNSLNKYNIPLPIKCFNDNLRSFISIYNLVNFIEHLIFFKNNFSGTYLLSDSEDLSTYNFLKRYSSLSNNNSKFFYVPKFVIKFFLSLLFRNDIYNKLNNSLRLNSIETFKKFNWYPEFSIEDTIKKYFDDK